MVLPRNGKPWDSYPAPGPVLITLRILSGSKKKDSDHMTLLLKTLWIPHAFRMNSECLLLPSPARRSPCLRCPCLPCCPSCSPCSHHAGLPSILSPSSAQFRLQDCLHLLAWPYSVLPWLVPSCYSASSSDVTFPETYALVEVGQPLPVTYASLCPVSQIYFLFALIAIWKNNLICLFFIRCLFHIK